VVVVDDDPNIRLLVNISLEHLDIEVVGAARTSREAIEMADATHPDLMVLDHLMPGGTGGDAIVDIRDVSPDTRIIMFSSSPQSTISALPDVFVSKREGVAALVTAVELDLAAHELDRPSMP
jgi:DNA-binding NarL/FixJ family response regulator